MSKPKDKESIDINLNLNVSDKKPHNKKSIEGESPETETKTQSDEPKVEKDIDNNIKDDTKLSENSGMEENSMSKPNENISNASLDALEKRLQSLTNRLSSLEEEKSALKESNLALKTQLTEQRQKAVSLELKVKDRSYESFKRDLLEQGRIVKAQLMVDDSTGKENLRSFYQSLNEDQQLSFREFCNLSPLPTLLNMSAKKETTESFQFDTTAGKKDKETFIMECTDNILSEKGVSYMDYYADSNLMAQVRNTAERAWEKYNK